MTTLQRKLAVAKAIKIKDDKFAPMHLRVNAAKLILKLWFHQGK